ASRFRRDLLTGVGGDAVVGDLLAGQFIDQAGFTGDPAYVFPHPLIRTVAYEAQLKSDRAELHRRLAAATESGDPAAVEENAALIAEHLEAAGDLHAAYGWHMRAATWSTNPDIAAAWLGWERARRVADGPPGDDADSGRRVGRADGRQVPRGSGVHLIRGIDAAGIEVATARIGSGGGASGRNPAGVPCRDGARSAAYGGLTGDQRRGQPEGGPDDAGARKPGAHPAHLHPPVS